MLGCGGMVAIGLCCPAGAATPIHYHPHQQIGSVVSGGIGFIVGGHPTRRLGPGATQHAPPDVWRGIVTHAPPREEALGV